MAITNNSSGYVVAVGDGTSAACIDPNNLCAQGTAEPQNPPSYTVYGSGISVGLGSAGMTATGTGLTYAVSSIPSTGLQLSVTSGGVQYYAEVKATGSASGMIPWGTFNTLGYNNPPDGGPFSGTGASITSVGFQVNAAPAAGTATPWSFCVTTLTL